MVSETSQLDRPGLRRSRLTAAQRREQILDVARSMVTRSGFRDVTLDGIAREAGVSRPVVYGHFGNLEGLFDALVDREGERSSAIVAQVAPTAFTGDPQSVLLNAYRAYLEFVAAEPETWRLLLRPPEGAPARLAERIAQSRLEALAHLVSYVAPGSASESDGTPDPELTARMLTLMTEESARLLLDDPEAYTIDRLMTHAAWFLSRFT